MFVMQQIQHKIASNFSFHVNKSTCIFFVLCFFFEFHMRRSIDVSEVAELGAATGA